MKEQKKQAQALDRIAASLEDSSSVALGRDTSRPDERLPLMARFILWAGASERSHRRAVAARRSFPIRGYVGPNGGGKSLACILDVLPSLDLGRTVLSTVAILDAQTGKPHRNYVPFTNFEQLLDAEHTDVIMDEIVGIANSRDAAKMPAPVQNALLQQRRKDNTLAWTAPSWARADKIIREVTQAVTECRGFYPGRGQAGPTDSGVRLWAPKRVFKFRTFDTIDFEEWTAGKRDKLDPLASQWFKGPGSRAFDSYDTLDSVSMVEGGDPDQCQYCGKKKRADYCRGHNGGVVDDVSIHLDGELVDIRTGEVRGVQAGLAAVGQ